MVVPVFRAAEALERCLESLRPTLGEIAQLVLLDDCSESAPVARLLSAASRWPSTQVLRGRSRRGFTHRVNQGLSQVAPSDAIILNSDTLVASGWASSLRLAAYQYDDAATATPLSDRAGPFSVPLGSLADQSAVELQRRLQEVWVPRFPVVPTGHGFCLYLRRDAVSRVGGFSQERFPNGYGSENDFCMRCAKEGFVHVLADNTIVLHREGASHGLRRRFHILRAQRTLKRLYPAYTQAISAWLEQEPLQGVTAAMSDLCPSEN